MEGQKLNIELTVTEWNVVMQALGGMPFAQVSNIIPTIQSQANAQLKPVDTTTEIAA